jgi:hypothetical protein
MKKCPRALIPFLSFAFCALAPTGLAQLSVSLTNPPANAIFPAGGSITMTANAAPTPGASITSVQFFQGPTQLGQSLSAPYTFAWNSVPLGSYSLQAFVSDSSGTNLGSTAIPIFVIAGLPYWTDFESSQGYSTGSVNGQQGWVVIQGDAEVTSSSAYSGTQSVLLMPRSPVTQLANTFASVAGQNVVYVDFFAEPAADSSVASSTLINPGSAEVGFLLTAGGALVETFSGNGSGGGVWSSTASSVTLPVVSGGNQTSAWHRFTFREDFSAKTWDLYVDGQMIAYDLPFLDPTVSGFGTFAISGHASVPTSLDYFFAGTDNPLFADVSNDGISDLWKAQFGLNPAQNDRYVAPSGNGATVIQEYVTGANPLDYFSGRAISESSPPASNQISYGYDASGRLTSVAFGNLSTQSFVLDPATNLTAVSATAQPIVAWRIANSLPPDGSAPGGDLATPAGDNLPNLAKYGLGLPALTAAVGNYPAISLTPAGGSSYLTLEYHRPNPAPADLTYAVQVSSDAQNWSGAVTPLSTTVTGSTADVIVSDTVPISSPQYGRYIRLTISRTLLP